MVSRPVGRFLDIEYDILAAATEMAAAGVPVYGFALARRLSDSASTRGLVGHGTLYKALGRLTEMGLLEADWELTEVDPGRPRRRLYGVTASGERALAARPVTSQSSAVTSAETSLA